MKDENLKIIGKSKQIKDLIDISLQVAKSDISVLIYGESGVGKEVFARTIHQFSNRTDKKLVSVNCGAIPEGILESELFGHKKGSFTGATDDRKGYFEMADKGTLFLDEIAEMPLTTQVKLLRVLETGEFLPLGSEITKTVDVRIIAATNKDLQTEVDTKRFRKDLYFRLKAVTLFIPPLRERKEDIILLINHFLKNYSEQNNIPLPKISDDAINMLTSFSWPGNIRELKNVIETSVALSRNNILTEESFRNLLTFSSTENEHRHLPVHLQRSSESLDRELIFSALIEIKKDLNELKKLAYQSNISDKSEEPNYNIDEIIPIEKLEKDAIKKALAFTNENKRKAANLLRISERTLYRKIKEYGI